MSAARHCASKRQNEQQGDQARDKSRNQPGCQPQREPGTGQRADQTIHIRQDQTEDDSDDQSHQNPADCVLVTDRGYRPLRRLIGPFDRLQNRGDARDNPARQTGGCPDPQPPPWLGEARPDLGAWLLRFATPQQKLDRASLEGFAKEIQDLVRQRLSQLLNKMEGNDKLEKLLSDVLGSTEKAAALAKEMGVSNEGGEAK